MSTPTEALERRIWQDALDQWEFLVKRELLHAQADLNTCERMLEYYLSVGVEGGVHAKVDHRVAYRAKCRKLRRSLGVIQIIRRSAR